jgi:hypothetical protein
MLEEERERGEAPKLSKMNAAKRIQSSTQKVLANIRYHQANIFLPAFLGKKVEKRQLQQMIKTDTKQHPDLSTCT